MGEPIGQIRLLSLDGTIDYLLPISRGYLQDTVPSAHGGRRSALRPRRRRRRRRRLGARENRVVVLPFKTRYANRPTHRAGSLAR